VICFIRGLYAFNVESDEVKEHLKDFYVRPKDKQSKPNSTRSPVEIKEITSVLSTAKVSTKNAGPIIEFDINTEAAPQISSPVLENKPTEQPVLLDCSPRRHIYFLKTHKTGSSTVQNILLRYGLKNNLNFALPKTPGCHVYDYNAPIHHSMVRPSKFNSPFDLLVNHNHYNHNAVRKILPHDDLFQLSILRHPAEHFESTVDYFRLDLDSILSAIHSMLPGVDIIKILMAGNTTVTSQKSDSFPPNKLSTLF